MSRKLADTLGIWLDECILDLRRRGYSERTHEGYRYNLITFIDWVEERPDLGVPGDLTTTVLEQYHLMLRPSLKTKFRHARTLSAGSRNLHLCALRVPQEDMQVAEQPQPGAGTSPSDLPRAQGDPERP